MHWGRISLMRAALAFAAMAASFTTTRAETPAGRGAYLVGTIMTCNNCHTPMGPNGPDFSKTLAGGLTFDVPPFTVTASNITPDKETGIGTWTDDQIEQTLRTGIRPNGVALAAVMPTGFYGIISDADMAAIVAYLRALPPIRNKVADPVYRIAIPREVFPGAEHQMTDGGGNAPLTRGTYLATIGHCMECHTPIQQDHHDFSTRLGAGGQEFTGPWGTTVSRNITSDPDKGLGRWTDAEIRRAITQGVSRDGTRLKPPMGYPYYARMTDADLNSLVVWLRTVPPLK